MEQIIQAIVFGLIQGLTEFIPISSTAHLRVIPALLGWGDKGAAFTAVIQMGTLIATFVYFKSDLIDVTKGFYSAAKSKKDFLKNPYSRIFILIIIGTIPISIAGVLLKSFIENEARGLYVISGSLIILAIILFIAEKTCIHKKDFSEITIKDGLIIGLAQVLSLIPGSSRSGVTITAGLFCGLKRDVAARFSFLLSVPAITLSGIYELYTERNILLNENLFSLIVATVVSGIIGYLSIAFLINYLKTKSNLIFIIYRIILGILILILLFTGKLIN
ncbi:MAG: undecaprenyl-diphosphatase UppP [Ignavibacteria bacterium]|nr:undecaprenyl-diphosphatase UppP [Ignavibacteria bacterium]